MPGLRLLLRMAPFLVGALATAVWLQRRRPQPIAPAPPPPVRSDRHRERGGRPAERRALVPHSGDAPQRSVLQCAWMYDF